MTERRQEMLWSLFVEDGEDRRDGGVVSVGFEAVWSILQDVKAGKRLAPPSDLLNSWLESTFWAGYGKDYLRASALKHDIRERFGGRALLIEPNNETSRDLYRAALEIGGASPFVAPKGNGQGHD